MANLLQRVIGQNEAIEAVSNAVRRSRAAWVTRSGPSVVFFFSGRRALEKLSLPEPRGVLFDDEKAIIRLNMSEYMERHAVCGSSEHRPATSVTTRVVN